MNEYLENYQNRIKEAHEAIYGAASNNEFIIGTIDLDPINEKLEIKLDKKSSPAKIGVLGSEGSSVPHFHIIFGPNDSHRIPLGGNKEAYQTCFQIFYPNYFIHKNDGTDVITLDDKEREAINKFLDAPYRKRVNIPDKYLYSTKELEAIADGKEKPNRPITNWQYLKYSYLSSNGGLDKYYEITERPDYTNLKEGEK